MQPASWRSSLFRRSALPWMSWCPPASPALLSCCWVLRWPAGLLTRSEAREAEASHPILETQVAVGRRTVWTGDGPGSRRTLRARGLMHYPQARVGGGRTLSHFPEAPCLQDPLPGTSPKQVTHTGQSRSPEGSGPGEDDTVKPRFWKGGRQGVMAGQPQLPLPPGRAWAAPGLQGAARNVIQELPGSGKILVL